MEVQERRGPRVVRAQEVVDEIVVTGVAAVGEEAADVVRRLMDEGDGCGSGEALTWESARTSMEINRTVRGDGEGMSSFRRRRLIRRGMRGDSAILAPSSSARVMTVLTDWKEP